MSGKLDIQEVIERSTSQVSLDDLGRKGVKKVKVLNQAAIKRLIVEAVDRVIAERAEKISSTEKKEIVEKSSQEFQELAKDELRRERERAEQLETANRTLSEQIQALTESARISASEKAAFEVASQRLAELERLETENQKLRESLDRRQSELTQVHEKLTQKAREIVAKEEELDRRAQSMEAELEMGGAGAEQIAEKEKEILELRVQLLEREKFLSRLEGELSAKNDELTRISSAGGADASSIQAALQGLQKSIASMGRGGGGGGAYGGATEVDTDTLLKFADRGDEISMETNVSKVSVNQKKSAGVGSSLAKLKKLNKGV